MQDIRRLKPSTVSRRMSVVSCFYRTCVIDGRLAHSPAEHVRRPRVPPESPTLGLTHLQFEALLTAARTSANPNDFALVCLLGLLGLRVFEATGISLNDLGEEHGHRVVRVHGKGGKVVLVPLPPAVSRAVDRAAGDRVHGPVPLEYSIVAVRRVDLGSVLLVDAGCGVFRVVLLPVGSAVDGRRACVPQRCGKGLCVPKTSSGS